MKHPYGSHVQKKMKSIFKKKDTIIIMYSCLILADVTVHMNNSNTYKAKVDVLRPVQQPGSYWERSSVLPLMGVEPTHRGDSL